METLADFLGLRAPSEDPPDDSPKLSSKASIRTRARYILSSPEYLQSVLDRIKLGTLPPALECQLYHYAYGKPVDRQEIKDTTNRLDGLTSEQVEQRATALMERARELRKAEKMEDPCEDGSVH